MSLEEKVGQLLSEKRLTLAVAESCTGGLLMDRITNVSGSSEYFLGGVVSYSNEAKQRILGVPREVLREHGAVSEPAARAMAKGVRKLVGSDLGVATTGIAGPTGGTREKPVGLVYIALSAPDLEVCEKHIWRGDRLENKARSAEAALELLISYLMKP